MHHRSMRSVRTLSILIIAALVTGGFAAGCSTDGRSVDQPVSTTSPTATSSPSVRSAAVTKLLVFVVENHSLDEMRRDMPYTFDLAEKYGYATGFRALLHPCCPTTSRSRAASTFDVTDDDPPSIHRIPGSSVFGQALARRQDSRAVRRGHAGGTAR